MRKPGIGSIIVVLAALSLGSAEARPHGSRTNARIEQCNRLQQQFAHAISEHAEAKRAAEARALQKKAMKYCAGHQQAQGIRAYATALKLLGEQPVEP